MSNPAIVLMTDPSRCSLGDVHYLLQALREMQQMGEHAVPQAFCDHPAAARDFIEAYAHAYPQLVLQDGGIPTPDHLQLLIANGQIGALGQPAELAPFGGHAALSGPLRPAEQNGSGGFPIVVLTLGSSQVLIDAMQQSPAMKESIRLIDIASEGGDSQPVSIAEAIAHGGLDGSDEWDTETLGGMRPELDEVAGASIRAAGDLALERDPLDLEGVETDDAPGSEAQAYAEGGAEEPATFEQVPSEAPAPVVAAEPAGEPTAAEEAYEASPSAEPVPEQASALATGWPDGAAPVEKSDPDAAEVLEEEGAADDAPPKNAASKDEADDDGADEEPDHAGGKGVLDDDDDVYYPPVGDLVAGNDVLYPALDQAAAQGVLQELVSVLLDDGIFDPDQAFEGLPPPPDEGMTVRLRADEQATIRTSEHVVTIEDLYGTLDQENEDVFAESGAARPSHDTDL